MVNSFVRQVSKGLSLTNSFKFDPFKDIGASFGSVLSNVLSNGFSTAVNNNINYRTWKRQFNAVNSYNDPKKVVQRNIAAGINPFFNGDVAQGSVSSATPSMPSPSPVTNGFGDAFNQIAQASLAYAKTPLQKALADSEILKNTKIANREQESAALLGLDRLIKSAKLPNGDYLSVALQKAAFENAVTDVDLKKTQMLVNKAVKALTDKQGELTDEQRQQLAKFNAVATEYYDSQIRLNKASTAQSSAAAGELNTRSDVNKATKANLEAQTETENVLRAQRFVGLLLDNDIKDLAKQFDAKTIKARIATVNEALTKYRLDNAKVLLECKRLKRENRFIEAEKVATIYKDIMQGQRDGVAAAKDIADIILPFIG